MNLPVRATSRDDLEQPETGNRAINLHADTRVVLNVPLCDTSGAPGKCCHLDI